MNSTMTLAQNHEKILKEIHKVELLGVKYKSDFESFLISPIENDPEVEFKNALYIESAPGRGVCMSLPTFNAVYKRAKDAEIVESTPCPETSIYEKFKDTLVGAAIGVLLTVLAINLGK